LSPSPRVQSAGGCGAKWARGGAEGTARADTPAARHRRHGAGENGHASGAETGVRSGEIRMPSEHHPPPSATPANQTVTANLKPGLPPFFTPELPQTP